MTKPSNLLFALAAAAAVLAAPAAQAASYTVPDHFSSIQEAANAASDNDVIYVRPGIYFENLQISEKSLVLRSLGGATRTIIDGSRGTTPTLWWSGSAGNWTIEGFTIQGGAGGLRFDDWTDQNRNLSLLVNDCIITNNRGTGLMVGGRPGAIAYVNVNRTSITNNTGTYGGGIYNLCSMMTFRDGVIANNTAKVGGGALTVYIAWINIYDSWITGNHATDTGGGLETDSYYAFYNVYNTVIDGNSADIAGGAVFSQGSQYEETVNLNNVTVTNNTAPDATFTGGQWGTARFNLTNTIVWGNNTPTAFALTGGAVLNASYSDIEGFLAPGTGNISADPMFVSSASRNFQVFPGSPVIDAGNADGYLAGQVDLLGTPRAGHGAAMDMGAYEWNEVIPPVSEGVVSGQQGDGGIYTGPATVTITGQDQTGLREIHYTLNGVESVVAGSTASFTLSTDGAYAVTWWAVDNYGNVEAAKSLPQIDVDLTPPTTTGTVTGTAGATGFYVSAVTVALSATDATTAVREVHYLLNGVETVVSGASASIPLSLDGTYRLSWWAVNAAGLVEPASAETVFAIDQAAPTITATVAGTLGNGGIYKSAATVSFAATDASEIHYTVNGAETVKAGATASVTLSATGTYALTFWAKDAAGNASPIQTRTVTVDVTAPAVTSTSPARSATGVSTGTSVTITFGESVTQGPNYSGVVLKRGSNTVSVSRSISGRVITLKPSSSLSSTTTYTVTVPAGAVLDAAGNPNAAYSFSFTTR